MTLADDAEARLKMMTAWDTDPVLTQAEITMILNDCKVPYYVPDTWDLDSGAASGWRIKAGKCANRFNFSSDVNSFAREQTYEHCLMQAKQYDKGAVQTIDIRKGNTYDPVLGNVDFTDD